MKHFGGGLLAVPLWTGVVVVASLVGVRWVDCELGIVAVLQSIVPLAGVLVVVSVGSWCLHEAVAPHVCIGSLADRLRHARGALGVRPHRGAWSW